jgi:hypothetical protein
MIKIITEGWHIAIRDGSTGDALHDRNKPFHVIRNELTSWATDPFVFDWDGCVYIFT